jgi:hypothetical protein
MTGIHNPQLTYSKRILVLLLVLLNPVAARTQTLIFDNPGGDNIWPVATNWDPDETPTTSSLAHIRDAATGSHSLIGFPSALRS